MGLVGRFYTRPRVFRLFTELGIYGNYLQIKQMLVVDGYYGKYERKLEVQQFAGSASLAVGFSLGSKRLRWEPYVQYGIIGKVSEKRENRVAAAAIGVFGDDKTVVISPFNFKFMLY